MPRFPPMGVSAVVDGTQNYLRDMGKMASSTERTHSRIAGLGRASLQGLVGAAGFAAKAVAGIGVAAGAVGVALGGLATKLALEAAPLVDFELGFNALAESAGRTGPEVLNELQKVSGGTIRAADLMALYNKGVTLLGENFNDVVPIMGEIIAQGAAIGLSPLQSVQDFTTGVARESKMILDNLGIVVSLEEAHEAYAKTLGKTKDELSATERQAALLAAASGSLLEVTEKLPSLEELATTQLAKMKASMANTKDEIGKSLVPVLQEFIGLVAEDMGESLGDIVAIFKRDFLPTIQRIAQFIGANLPKFIRFAVQGFQFFGRIFQRVTDFMFQWGIPAFNELYRIFVDKVLPIIRRGWEFLTNLYDTLFGGGDIIGTFKDWLLGMIPQPVKDAVQGIIDKVGEWYTVALEWINTHGPDMLQAFTDIKDYIVTEFVPNAIEYLTEKFTPVIDAAGNLWDALVDKKPDVIQAWDDIKRKAREVFGESIPGWLTNLDQIWTNLIILIKGDIDDTTESINKWGTTWIETIGDIIEFGLNLLGIAITGIIDLVLILTQALISLRTGDWAPLGELFTTLGEDARKRLFDLGLDVADILNLNLPGMRPDTGPGRPHQLGPMNTVPAPATVSGGGVLHSEAQTQNFSLTVNTSAPAEDTIADFRMMAAMARGAIP